MAKSDGVREEFMKLRADVVHKYQYEHLEYRYVQGKRTKCLERTPGAGDGSVSSKP